MLRLMSVSGSVKSEYIKLFFQSPVFLSAVGSWFFAQLIKTIVVLLKSRKQSLRDIMETLLWRSGGMPSSHSALVASLAASVGFAEGIDSNLFIVTLFIAFIIMRDSLGVRRSSGIQGKVLNNLGKNVSEKMPIEFHPVKEVHGHTPLEVVIGSLLGIFIAAAFFYL